MCEAKVGVLRDPAATPVDAGAAHLLTEAVRRVVLTTDTTGRQLGVRQLTALDRLRLFKTVGAELVNNPAYLGMALLATSVTEIDGMPVPRPVTEAQLEGLVQRLGDSGLEAVGLVIEQVASADMTEADAGN